MAELVGDADEILAALAAELDENSVRKGFTRSEAVAIGDAIEERERERARERIAATHLNGRHADGTPAFGGDKKTPPTDDGAAGRVRDIVAARVGMSGSTYEKAKAVVNSGTRVAMHGAFSCASC